MLQVADTFWQRIALAFVETGGGAGGFATILALLFGVVPLLEKAVTGQAKVGIGELRSEIRDLDKKVDSLMNEMKADSESLMTVVVVVPLLIAAATVVLVIWMMRTN